MISKHTQALLEYVFCNEEIAELVKAMGDA